MKLQLQLLQKMKSMGVTFNPHIYALFPTVITLPSYFEITLGSRNPPSDSQYCEANCAHMDRLSNFFHPPGKHPSSMNGNFIHRHIERNCECLCFYCKLSAVLQHSLFSALCSLFFFFR